MFTVKPARAQDSMLRQTLAQHSRFPFVIHALFAPLFPFLLAPAVDYDLACVVQGTSVGQ